MVFFDGEFLCVQMARVKNYKIVLDLAKNADKFEYLQDVGIFCLPPTRRNARVLYENGYGFDESAKIFLKEKQKRIDVDDLPEELYPFQKEGVRRILSVSDNVLLADEMGCLDGESIVTINRCKKSEKLTLAEFYDYFHRKGKYENVKFRKNAPCYIRSYNEGYFRLGEVVDVIDSGFKECVKVKTESGYELILTPDHEIYTKNGIVKAEESLNVEIVTNGLNVCPNCGSNKDLITYQYSKFRGYCKTCMYKLRENEKWKDREVHEIIGNDGYIYLQGYPLQGYKGRKWRGDGVPKHTYVMEQYLGRFLKAGEVVHHIDGNRLNNDISNLMLLNDASAHGKIHGMEKYRNFGFVNPKFEKIVSVEKVGVRHVFDVKVLNHNNFVANHILVHNCGKTCQVCTYLKYNKDSLPAVVVCQSSLKLNWEREVERWAGLKSTILEGRKTQMFSDEYFEKYPVIIINYDILGAENQTEKRAELERQKYCKENGLYYKKKHLKVSGWVDELARHNFKTVIVDECQYISEPEAVRSRAVIQLCSAGDSRKIFISGTPFETRPSQFFTALNILSPRLFPNRWAYLMRYCDPVKTYFGWQFKGLSNGVELHSKISNFMIRRLKKDVLTQLPPKQRIVVPMQVSAKDRGIYDKVDAEFIEALGRGESNALVKISQLKRASFEAKRNAVLQWVNDWFSVEDKLVLFVYHKDAFDFFMESFKGVCVGINGETEVVQRQRNIDRFQNDEAVKLFVGQIKACGAGITLTASKATCFVEFGQTVVQHEQAEDRVHRIGQKADSVQAFYLILEDSIDNSIMDILNGHNKGIKEVLNGEADTDMFGNLDNNAILKKYKEKKR